MSNKYQNQQKPITSEFGKLPPQAPEIEEAVLGALLLEPKSIDLVSLNADDFYKPEHSLIYQAIIELDTNKIPIDPLTVTERLRKNERLDDVGGPYYLSVLQSKVSSSAHIEYHCQILKQKSDARKIIALTSNIQALAFSENDISEITELFDSSFTEIQSGSKKEKFYTMNQSLSATLEKIKETASNRRNGIDLSVHTGLEDLNKSLNGGWTSPDLIVIGGRPAMGKTQFSLLFAESAAQEKNVTFVSLEMTKEQLVTRLITKDDDINFYNLKTGQLNTDEWNAIDRNIGLLSSLKLDIADEKETECLQGIKSLTRKRKRDGKLDLLIIDYLQLIRTNIPFKSRQLEVAHITRELKSLAKELSIPIIILAQLNRPERGVAVKIPQLQDLREAGDIEQDADIVIFIHRPSYYDQEAKDKDDISWDGRGILIKAKHREGKKDEFIYFKHNESFKRIIGKNDSFETTYIERTNFIEPNYKFEDEKRTDEMPF